MNEWWFSCVVAQLNGVADLQDSTETLIFLNIEKDKHIYFNTLYNTCIQSVKEDILAFLLLNVFIRNRKLIAKGRTLVVEQYRLFLLLISC